MRLERAEIAALYERYLACCNEHRFDQLGEFVSEQVSGSGAADGLAGYIDRLKTVHAAFPDYRWDLQELVVEQRHDRRTVDRSGDAHRTLRRHRSHRPEDQ